MADNVIWGIDFRARARREHEETIEQRMVREIMGMGFIPDDQFPWPWSTKSRAEYDVQAGCYFPPKDSS